MLFFLFSDDHILCSNPKTSSGLLQPPAASNTQSATQLIKAALCTTVPPAQFCHYRVLCCTEELRSFRTSTVPLYPASASLNTSLRYLICFFSFSLLKCDERSPTHLYQQFAHPRTTRKSIARPQSFVAPLQPLRMPTLYQTRAEMLRTSLTVSLDIFKKTTSIPHSETVIAGLQDPCSNISLLKKSEKSFRLSPHRLKGHQKLSKQVLSMILYTTVCSWLRRVRSSPTNSTLSLSNPSQIFLLPLSSSAAFSTHLVLAKVQTS